MVVCWHSRVRYTRVNVDIAVYVYTTVIIFGVINYASCTATMPRQSEHYKETAVTFTVNEQDIKISVGNDDSFSINASAPVKDHVLLQLSNDNTHTATVVPMVTMKAGTDSVVIAVNSVHIGSCTISINVANNFYKNSSSDLLTVRVHVRRSFMLTLLTWTASWFYSILWTVHLLPQVYLNYQRKSVVGLSFDYLTVAAMSYFFYAIYDMVNYWSTEIKEIYMSKYPPAPGVDYIDAKTVVFSILNFLIITITCMQCFKYERGDQKISNISKCALGIIQLLFFVLIIIVLASNEGLITWIIFFHIIAYLNVALIFTKFVPQLFMNYDRKSTEGWSVAFPVLDLLCGTLTVTEMLLVSFNYGNWIAFKVKPARICIAIISIIFSSMFLVQHYFLYRLTAEYDTIPILGAEEGKNKTIQGPEEEENIQFLEEGNELRTLSKDK